MHGPSPFAAAIFTPRTYSSSARPRSSALIALWQAGLQPRMGQSPFLRRRRCASSTRLRQMAASGVLAEHIGASLARLFGGFALGMTTGVGFGLMIGLFSIFRSPGVAVVSALFPIPKIALLPLFILWFGIGEGSKVATIAFGTFFPTVVATYGAVDNVDRTLVRMGRSFDLSAFDIVRKIILPGALPGILSGLRIASSIGIVLLIAAEMIGANRGIGALVLQAGNLMQTDQLLAGVVLLSILGLTIAGVIGAIERRLLAWR